MRGWLRRGVSALQVAGDRSDLWLPGALAWLVFLGWVPLVIAIAPPDAEGIEAFGVSLYLSQAFPLNVALLAAGVVAGFSAVCVVVAAAEVAIEQAAVPRAEHPSAARATLTAFTIIFVCAVPVVAAAGLVLGGIFAVAPAEYLSADLTTPILLRIAARLAPQLALLLVALLAMQAIGGVALRASFTHSGRPATAALGAAIRHIRERPLPVVGVAFVGLLLDVLLVGGSYLLLTALWQPVGLGLGDGLRSRPETILLLLGFVAVWLGLLLTAGALHVAVSAWWSMEVGGGRTRMTPAAPAAPADAAGPVAGSETGGAH